MRSPLTVEDAIRIWRGTQVQQAFCAPIRADGGRCAMGVLGGENLGFDHLGVIWNGRSHSEDLEDEIGRLYGFNKTEVAQIIELNDSSELSFSEIADAVEAWSL